ncbi:unnamed protein product, partial [Caretta caretta]
PNVNKDLDPAAPGQATIEEMPSAWGSHQLLGKRDPGFDSTWQFLWS